jgi:hypothetical protein
MAVTIEQIKQELDSGGIKYNPVPNDPTGLAIIFGTQNYTDSAGLKSLGLYLSLEENGEYIKVMAPGAFAVGGDHFWEFLEACLWLQARTKLVQFELGDGAMAGKMSPVVEWPVEDGTVTTKQLLRAVMGLGAIVEEYSPALMAVMETGVVDAKLKPL